MPAPVRIKIRGEDFSSITAASRHFGVHRNTVLYHLENGTLEEVGLDPHAVTYKGHTYKNLSAMATVHNVCVSTAARMLRDPAYIPSVRRFKLPGHTTVFKNKRAAARWLGVSEKTIYSLSSPEASAAQYERLKQLTLNRTEQS